MAFNNVNNQLQYIAKNGNYQDIANAMTLICAYSKIYTTGQVPTMQNLRKGIQASAVAGLEAMLTGATAQTNSIQDYNTTRDAFFAYVAATSPGFYEAIDRRLWDRLCLTELTALPEALTDCVGTNYGVVDIDDYIVVWNQIQDINYALCGTTPSYVFNTGGMIGLSYMLGMSPFQPTNSNIHFNAPAVTDFRQRGTFEANRDTLVDREAEEKPQAIAKYSSDTL
jgi:hypothetical protein